MSNTRASNRDGDEAVTKKYIGNVSDGPTTIPDVDSTSAHEGMWKNMELSKPQLEAHLQKMALPELKRLAVRQRQRLAGDHTPPEVNQESRKVTLDHISPLAAARLFVANMFPKISRTSAKFNECVAFVLMSEDEQNLYLERHPDA
jgi:hypothetical protein